MLLCAGISVSVSELDDIGDRLLVIFDGYCGFCNRSVRWFLRRDGDDRLRFVPSDSPRANELLTRYGLGLPGSELGPNTIVVVRNAGRPDERVFLRSDAARELLGELPQPWRTAGIVFGWIPRPVRDLGYRLIARWRYRIWGRLESCPIPTAAERARFL
ncbi:MAG: DCC1-like thiol-disulfide oxidoreductase family protein [Terracidiphilus sp.]|jgi:predicted DCC family thiol-disulfide oxidoreductase YuxK